MPKYGYRCNICEEEFEQEHRIGTAPASTDCPICGAESKRIFTSVGVAFKGSGFHNTDYRPKPGGGGDCDSCVKSAGGG